MTAPRKMALAVAVMNMKRRIMTEMSNKMQAALLLRKYDSYAGAACTEQSLSKAVTTYGRETGHWD